MVVPTSPAEVAARVIAGLIDVAAVREDAVGRLTAAVTRAVDELDPAHERDTDPTWLRDLPPWAKLDALDRLRKAYDDLMILEVQAKAVVDDLRLMLTPQPIGSKRRPMRLSPGRAHALLSDMAPRRQVYLVQMSNAERRLRPRLERLTHEELRRALRHIQAEEDRGAQHQARLGLLLSMGESAAS